jgi:hypothetical protein
MECYTEVLDQDIGAVHFGDGAEQLTVLFGIGDVSAAKVRNAKAAIIEERTWEAMLDDLREQTKHLERDTQFMEEYPEVAEALAPEQKLYHSLGP